MKAEDYEALYELMSELAWADAIKLYRAETGHSLRDAGWVIQTVVRKFPVSVLAQSRRPHP